MSEWSDRKFKREQETFEARKRRYLATETSRASNRSRMTEAEINKHKHTLRTASGASAGLVANGRRQITLPRLEFLEQAYESGEMERPSQRSYHQRDESW